MRYLVVYAKGVPVTAYVQEGTAATLIAAKLKEDKPSLGKTYNVLEHRYFFTKRARLASALYCCLKFGVSL